MPTAYEKIEDDLIRRQVYLLQYSEGLANDAAIEFGKTRAEIRRLILDGLDDVGSNVLSSQTRRALVKLEKQIYDVRKPVWKAFGATMRGEMQQLAKDEAVFYIDVLQRNIPLADTLSKPTAATLASIVDDIPFEGRVLESWVASSMAEDRRRIELTLKSAVMQGLNASDVATAVTGTRKLNYRDGVLTKAVNSSASLAYTATPSVRHEATTKAAMANEFVVSQEYFVATLDARTTIQCAQYDGQVFDLNKGPRPPLHFRCRSLRLPYLDVDGLSSRPFDPTSERELLKNFTESNDMKVVRSRDSLPRGTKGKFDEYSRAQKRKLIGEVPERVTYDKFLKRQSAEFQEEVLGVAHAKLYREGKLTLDKFVNKAGKTRTLEELRILAGI